MSENYKLSIRALNFLTSSSDDNFIRQFLFHVLQQGASQPASLQQLMAWNGKPEKELKQLVSKMLELDWLRRVEDLEYTHDLFDDSRLAELLRQLSSNDQALLADDQGLLVMNSGFAHENADYLAASSARLLSVNEVSRQRNLDLYTGQPWSLTMHWGSLQARAQYLCLGSARFVLLIAGKRQFDTPAFLELLASLAMRYVHE